MTQLVNISWTDGGPTFSLDIDATTNEQHDADNTVTDHPVETGANIADHVRQEPDALTITGTISNTPIHLPGDHNGGAKATTADVFATWDGNDSRGTAHGAKKVLSDFLPVPHLLPAIPVGGGDEASIGRLTTGGRAVATVNTFSLPFDRVKDCDQALLQLRNSGNVCRVITSLRTYESMAIVKYGVPRSVEQGNALVFTITFKRIASGSTKTTKIPALPIKKISKGATPTKPPPPIPDGKSSVLHKFLDLFK